MNNQRQILQFRQEQLHRRINAALDLLQRLLHKSPSQRGFRLTTKVDQKTVTNHVRAEVVYLKIATIISRTLLGLIVAKPLEIFDCRCGKRINCR